MTPSTDSFNKNDVIEIDLQELIGLLIHRLVFILGIGILAAVFGFAVSCFVITPKYESTTSIYIMNSDDGNKSGLTYSDTQLATALTKDYEELITSRHVLEQVIAQYELEETYKELKKRVEVDNLNDTRIINITVKDESPVRAKELVDAIRDISSERIESVMNIEAVNLVDEGNLAIEPSEPSVVKWTVISFLVGIFVCAAVIIIRYLQDDTIKSSEDIEKYLGLSSLALIPDADLEGKMSEKKRKRTKSVSAVSAPKKTNDKESKPDVEIVDLGSES